MEAWQNQLEHDPIPSLLSAKNQALVYFARRDLLDEQAGPVDSLWQLPEVLRILKKQQANGSWLRSGENKHPAINVHLIETWRNFHLLVDMYGFTCRHPAARKAAEYLFSCQTREGDFRGMLANQYATYYTGAIMETLIRAGYGDDPRIEKGFQWLLTMRQDDLGWSIPIITYPFDRLTQYRLTSEFEPPVEPDRSKPFSHNWTGMVLRAFAAHPIYRKSEAARTGANLLKTRFFQPDCYTSYQAASYWVRFEYPFWWNNLVAALDSITRIGCSAEDEQIRRALAWLAGHQEGDGLWKVTYAKEEEKETARMREVRPWIALAICRIFKRIFG